jgi:protease IV
MSLPPDPARPDPDLLVDRRRLKRGLAAWRIVAILAGLAAVLIAVQSQGPALEGDHVARYTVEGIILSDTERDEALAELADDDAVKALLVHIDSPGGTLPGSEMLFQVLRKVAARKPVVAVMDSVAASGGYMAALAADRVFAQRSTITGSIGVIMQTADVTGLLDKLGVTAEAIKSGPLKGEPNPLAPMTEEVRRATQHVIDEMFALFVDMVAEARGMDRAEVVRLADGRIYSGQEAVRLGLIDAVGGEDEARAWLASEHAVDVDLPVTDVVPGYETRTLLEDLVGMAGKTLIPEPLILDGLLVVWHPAL